MTKRLLALVLALLLPVAALAETYCLEISVTLDAENAKDVFKASGLFEGASDEDGIALAFAELLDGISLRLVTQEDAGRLTLAFDETNLLDMSVIARGQDLVIASDLFAGRGLLIPGDAASESDEEFAQMLENTDWMQLLDGVISAAMAHLDGFEISTWRGSFSGDAYEGGVYCTTVTFDDADLAALLSAVMTEELRGIILSLAQAMGIDGEAFLAQIDAAHQKAATGNEHRYILRLVSDASEQPIGLSAVVMQGENQLGTLSLGYKDSEIRIVVGFSADDVNYWHCQGIRVLHSTDEKGIETFQLDGAIIEFTAPKDEAFAFAAAVNEETVYELSWSAQINLQGNNATWSYASTQGDVDVKGQGFFVMGNRFNNTCTYSLNGKNYMTERISWSPCDPIDVNVGSLELCDVTGEDLDLMDEIVMDLQNELIMRLLQVIPMKLLLQVQ